MQDSSGIGGLALLANITELDMDTNELTGPLPPEWGCLGNLIEIDFSNNRLTGTIPPEWGLLSG
ncbi:putative inactive receptor kinase At5g53320-like protein [Tetrabaena socialis]|uniref:Putative inactive receptor kinase At5g53320-like protein n=1 Tax=Tetrabaena socialis TaxID=47790 RepID=A0A2J8A931_9CHLO|nr:putative inactive receptor kinase At5g53320-like protein [Tetrabaena socialis]|eukprot:PNH09037.1 putative inactive receptor kinase At5g53320-like protein [Tetrabaena socialis]